MFDTLSNNKLKQCFSKACPDNAAKKVQCVKMKDNNRESLNPSIVTASKLDLQKQDIFLMTFPFQFETKNGETSVEIVVAS